MLLPQCRSRVLARWLSRCPVDGHLKKKIVFNYFSTTATFIYTKKKWDKSNTLVLKLVNKVLAAYNNFSYVVLWIFHLSRPHSVLWMTSFQILAKSLAVCTYKYMLSWYILYECVKDVLYAILVLTVCSSRLLPYRSPAAWGTQENYLGT